MNPLVVDIVLLLVILAISITAHEFMHAFASFKLGDDTALLSGRLTLNPLAHVDPFATVLMPIVLYVLTGIPIGAAKPVPFNPSRLRHGEYGAAIVAAAGPLTNLGLALFFALWLQLFPMGPLLTNFFVLSVVFNLVFFIFNLIPFPPLDGSRVVYPFLPEPVREVMRTIEAFGIMAVILILVILVYTFPFIGSVIGSILETMLGWLLPLAAS